MADKIVIEKKQYVDLLNQTNALSKYGFQEIMNKIGLAGTNWKYDGSRSIVFRDIVTGMDSPIVKQTLIKGGVQAWSMKDATKTIEREREYYDLSDEIYASTANVDGMRIMAKYEAQGRPLTVTRGISEDLFKEASSYTEVSGVIDADISTLTGNQAWALFDEAKAKIEDNSMYDSQLIFYCIPQFLRKLRDSDINKRVILNGVDAIAREIASIDGVQIRTIRPQNMMSKYDGTQDNAGLVAASDAKQVYAFMIAVDSIAVPFIIENAYIDAPHAGSKGKWEIDNRFAFNAFMNPFWGLGVVAIAHKAGAVQSQVNP